ncbi:Zinc finger protein 850 [Frankliniella fusca]|uniref:Zinc finger protein 850 n=1 Tax=Frankliniella fusca TaxID=407009 RepID=A0AAE1GRL8_9NEOP|nr:Zinc finger protein 850 [Frankliniella fusca]
MSPVPIRMNLQQTCRLCLGQGGVLSPIFQESVGGGEGSRSAPQPAQPQPTLPLRIMACVPIQVLEGDALPAQICHRCLYQVERSYDFKEQCVTSDKILRQYVAQALDQPKKEYDEKLCDNAAFSGKKLPLSKDIDVTPSGLVDLTSVTNGVPAKKIKLSEAHKEVKFNILQSKLSAIIHQHPSASPEEDVDSGLLESLADCEDLLVVRSEVEEESHHNVKMEDDASDRSDSSEDDIRLRCKMCKDTFPYIDILEAHEAAHDATGSPYLCSICDKVFTERNLLDTHWQVHSGENPLQCPLCETVFPSEDSLEDHLESHDSSLPFSCLTCDKAYSSRSDLMKHSVIHSGLRPFKCKICPKEFARSTNFNKHTRAHIGQKLFSCSDCPKTFKTKGDLHRHEIIHTGQKPFSCSLCNLSFNRKDKLVRHERLHSSGNPFTAHGMIFKSEDQPVQEEATDLSMPSKKEALNDQQLEGEFNDDDSTVDTEPENQLQICEDPVDEGVSDAQTSDADKLEENGKQSGVESMVISLDPFQMERMDSSVKEPEIPSNFSSSSIKPDYEKEEFSPNENEMEANIQENTKPYACEYCPKKFADKSYMKTHQLTHLGIRPHACSYCGKGFFRRRELLRHEAVHTGIKPFTCKTCNKAFARSDKLMRHERTHGEPKNFNCSQCPAVFSRKDELSRHGMCHTGERPHCCSQCFKSFFSRAELTRHEKTHAGLKPFKCDYCDQSFHRRDKLNRHVRTHLSPAAPTADTNILGTVHLHDLLAAHCGQHFAAEVRVKEEKSDAGDELKVRVDGSIDARALARLNQNPDIHLIPLKQN